MEKLNEHFTTTAYRTTGRNAISIRELDDFIESLNNNSNTCQAFQLRHVTINEVSRIICTLRSDSSTGDDQIPVKYLKLVSKYIAVPITNLINKCISKSYFPKVWKTARVSPVPKVDNPVTDDQFRPISILPGLSKVFEKVVALQITDYIEGHGSLHDKITGFRKGHSTTTTLLGIKDDIVRAMKKRDVTLMVLADFSKAFDTVCFKSVITKLHKLNFSKPFLKWIFSYLTDRSQFVQVDDKRSTSTGVNFGIPQGSILGPMLFNLYVSDLKNCIDQQTTCYQYADDTTLYKHCKFTDLQRCEAAMNDNLKQMTTWSSDSNLTLNASKTKCMVFFNPTAI